MGSRPLRMLMALAPGIVACGLASPANAQLAPYDVRPPVEPPYHRVRYEASTQPGGLIFPATYTAWIPPGVTQLRGVIVHQHGCGEGSCSSGLSGAHDLHWQALARAHHCALVAPAYEQPEGADCQMWCDPRNGSATAFERALADLGTASGHPELATVPWALWGHSGGGHWAGGMSLLRPERVVAAWLRSGVPLLEPDPQRAGIKPHTLVDAALRVPIMCNPGTKEGVTVTEGRFKGVWPANRAFFTAIRARGGLVGVAIDPLTSHECGNQRYLAIPWLDACLAARLRPQPGGKTRVEPGYREIPLVAALVTRERVDRHADEAAARTDGREERAVRGPHALEPALGDRDTLLRAGVAHDRHPQGRVDERVRLDPGPLRIGLQQRHTRAEPGGDDPLGTQQAHASGPVAATTVPPQRPGHGGQLRVAARGAEIREGPLERGGRSVPRVAPHLAVGPLRLLVGRGDEGTVMGPRQRLPVQIVGAGEARRARSFATAVLVHDHAPQLRDTRRNPRRVRRRKDQAPRLRGRLVADSMVRGLDRRPHVVRGKLRVGRGGETAGHDPGRERHQHPKRPGTHHALVTVRGPLVPAAALPRSPATGSSCRTTRRRRPARNRPARSPSPCGAR